MKTTSAFVLFAILLPLTSSFNGPSFLPNFVTKKTDAPARSNPAAPFLLPVFLASSLIFAPPPTSPLPTFLQSPPAVAKEMASGSGSKVNKDAESLLRYGLPGIPKEARKLQKFVETTKDDLESKRYSAAKDGASKALSVLNGKESAKIASATSSPDAAKKTLSQMASDLKSFDAAVTEAQNVNRGSEQEQIAIKKAKTFQVSAVSALNDIEESMVPKNYKVEVSDEYKNLPKLQGRATVEMVFKKDGGAPFDIEGTNFASAKMTMVLDGYAAPVTSGNFVELVNKGFYNSMKIQRSDGFVVQTGDPDGEAEGYVDSSSDSKPSLGKGKHGERLIPLEIMVKGDKSPFYEESIEDNGRGGQATVLPFSSYGAMGWAREEYEANSGSSQFFWLLFDSDLTPAGKNVLDGRYPCFGYVTEGADFLRDIKEGDTIVSAKVIKGADQLYY